MNTYYTGLHYGGVAQPGERVLRMYEVRGSIPLISTRKTVDSIRIYRFFQLNKSIYEM